jgi:lysophospholipase L1-like esterase
MPHARFPRAAGLALAFALVQILSGCEAHPIGSAGETMRWDTAFQVEDIAFPEAAVLARSVVEPGDARRLSAFYRKCRAREEVGIGFIGGSITEGALATRSAVRYSARLCGFLENAFPGLEVREINAGIGATDSRFACSRVKDDLLEYRPDLIVLEFAVNDQTNPSAAETFEGLIRQSLGDPDVPVLIFQTMNSRGDSVPHGIQRKLGRHYGLPVIGYRSGLWPLVASGSLSWESLSPDDVHPNDDGHLIAAYLLYAFLKSGYPALEEAEGSPPLLPRCLMGDLYQSAGCLRPDDTAFAIVSAAGWNPVVDGKGRLGFVSGAKGDRLAFRTEAREVTLSFHHARELDAQAEVYVDSVLVGTLSSHFPQDWGGGYLKPFQVYRQEERRERRVEIVNATGGRFDLRYVLYAE